jgi:HAD superfamily hydrolase (TIGR01549 family)
MERSQGLKIVVFDLDGTLYNLNVDWSHLHDQLNELGYAQAKVGEQIAQVVERHDTTSAELVTRAEIAGVNEGSPIPGASEVLTQLCNTFSVAILTRNSRRAAIRAFEIMQITTDVVIVGREDVARLKPNPEGLQRILSLLNATADELCLVGDTYHDVKAATALGATSVIVANNKLDYSPQGAHFYLQDLAGLPDLLSP